MIIELKVGDVVLVQGHFKFTNHYATIYFIDSNEILLYSDDLYKGHNAAFMDSDWSDRGLPEPTNKEGSWWCGRPHIDGKIISKVGSSEISLRHPNWKVIRKIKEMQDRRRKMGYEYV